MALDWPWTTGSGLSYKAGETLSWRLLLRVGARLGGLIASEALTLQFHCLSLVRRLKHSYGAFCIMGGCKALDEIQPLCSRCWALSAAPLPAVIEREPRYGRLELSAGAGTLKFLNLK